MRMLFNHGLATKDLFVNTPKKITDKHWRWLIKHCGAEKNSYEDALSDPFKYCLNLVINSVIDEKKRFKIPVAWESYIDFKIVKGDDFIRDRQNGRFQEIDFIESDFTGYCLTYFWKSKAYQKSVQIYVGGDIKKKFLGKINSGEKFYTTKDLTVNDFIDQVAEKFTALSKSEVKRMVLHGFRRMHSAIMFGCTITINSTKFGNCYLFIGSIYLNPKKQIENYISRRDRKIRIMKKWQKVEFTGHYYIGLNENRMSEFYEVNKKARTTLLFSNVIARKYLEELAYRSNKVYVFKVKHKFSGYTKYLPNFKSRDVEYVGYFVGNKLYHSTEEWRNFIKNYETRDS